MSRHIHSITEYLDYPKTKSRILFIMRRCELFAVARVLRLVYDLNPAQAKGRVTIEKHPERPDRKRYVLDNTHLIGEFKRYEPQISEVGENAGQFTRKYLTGKMAYITPLDEPVVLPGLNYGVNAGRERITRDILDGIALCFEEGFYDDPNTHTMAHLNKLPCGVRPLPTK